MKLNTLRAKATGILAALVIIYWLTSAVFGGKSSQAGNYELFAAPLVDAGKAEVRLRWVMKTGWLPAGGFKLYRSESGGPEVLLNPAALGTNPGNLANSPWKAPAAPKPNEGKTQQKLQFTYQEAVQAVHADQNKLPAAIFSLQPGKRLPSSVSAQAFQALKQQREKLYHPPAIEPMPKGKQIANIAPSAAPALASYYAYLGQEQAAQGIQPMKLAPESPTSMLRTHLVIGALLHPETIGADLGLAFTDSKVEVGKKYHYVLKVVDKGNPAKHTTVAERDVTVQNDAPLAAPAGLTGFQFDATTVCLRWERIAPTGNTGLVSYDLYRIDNNNAEPGKRINQLPIVIRDLPIRSQTKGDATHIEPIVHFQDGAVGSAAPGEVTYKLIAIDMFGRRSSATSIKVKLEDLLAPTTVQHFAAERSAKGSKVQLVWSKSAEPNVLYNISRIDRETKKEEVLGQVAGDALPALLPEYRHLDEIVHPKARSFKSGKPAQSGDVSKKVEWLAFADTPPQDHTFAYRITAVYKNHPRSSPAQISVDIPVPSLTAPASPTVHGSFVSADKLPKTSDSPNPNTSKRSFLHAPEYRSVKPTDLAGAVHLTWNAVPKAQSYRIYRVSGTGFRPSASDTPADIKVGDAGRFRHHAEIPESALKDGEYFLVGQVNEKTEFFDYMARSQSHTYWYRVVAVNRWDIPVTNATAQHWSKAIKVRVPSTVPPAAPILVAALPDYAGNITLAIRAPAASEGKVTYHVYRGETSLQGASRTYIKGHKEISQSTGQRKGDEIALVDKLVQTGRTYEYYIIADNAETPPVFSPASNKLRASTFKALVIAPTNVEAIKKGNEIQIQWHSVANAAGYIVERALGGPKGEFVQISDMQTGASFVDRTPGTKGPIYTYRVIAVDSAGNVSNPNDYPLNQQQKDPSQYPAQKSVYVKAP